MVSIAPISKGEGFSAQNVWVKRPGTGHIKAVDFRKVLGRKAKTDITKDTQLTWEMVD